MSSKASSKSEKQNAQNNGSGQSGDQGSVGATASETMGQVQDTVSGLGEQVKQQASNQLSARLDTAASGLDMATKVLRTAADQVRGQDKTAAANSITSIADRIEGWSASLREQDVDKLMEEARDLAQRQPGLFVGGATLLGFLGARFFRSSAKAQPATSSSGSEQASSSGTSVDTMATAGTGADFENTNPYPSAEENAALEASLDDALERDDMTGLNNAMSAPGVTDLPPLDQPGFTTDVDDPLLDEPGFTTDVDDPLLDEPGSSSRVGDR